MKETIIGYLKEYGNFTFEEKAMNDVDSLVLCQLSYLKFDGMVPGVMEEKPFVSLKEVSQREDVDNLFSDERFARDNRALFESTLATKRFGDLKMNCYENIIITQDDFQTQFSAVTFLLGDGTLYVAYRGTDESIIGWKEDVNMAFIHPVPGQAYSVKYLNIVAAKFNKRMYLGGHSKGGNFAVYAAMKCRPTTREQIEKIYCMDGPGFRPEVLKECDYEAVKHKVVRFLPQSSLVGRLLDIDDHYRVVKSKSFGIMQHNPFNWLIKGDSFIEVPKTDFGSDMLKETINGWVYSQDQEHLRKVTETLFQVVETTNAENLLELEADKKNSFGKMKQAMKELDEEDREMVKTVFQALFTMARENMKKDLAEKVKKALFLKPREKKNEQNVKQDEDLTQEQKTAGEGENK